jgi:hypothetical protein
MAWALVQKAALGSVNTAVATASSLAFGANPTVGNWIVIWAWGWTDQTHNQTPALSDTGGNTYTIPTNAYQNQATDLWCICGWTKVATSGASFKVTSGGPATSLTNGPSINVCGAEFSGGASSAADGNAVGTTGTSVTIAPGSLSFTANDLIVSVSVDDNTTYGGSTPSGFTRADFQNNGTNFQVGEGIYAIGPASPTNPSRTITSAKWASSQFGLLAGAGGPVLIDLMHRPSFMPLLTM